jgi:hypothetical protein
MSQWIWVLTAVAVIVVIAVVVVAATYANARKRTPPTGDRCIDDPTTAVGTADGLVIEVMRARGYPRTVREVAGDQRQRHITGVTRVTTHEQSQVLDHSGDRIEPATTGSGSRARWDSVEAGFVGGPGPVERHRRKAACLLREGVSRGG